MNCEKCQELLSEYQEGELDKKLSGEIEKHLKGCKRCRQELNSLQKINVLTKKLPRYAPNNEVIRNIKTSIYQESKATRRREFGPVLDMEELTEFLRVSKETLEEYLNEIPCFELGGKILFRRKSIEEWIEERERAFGLGFLVSELTRIDKEEVSLEYEKGGRRWRI